jgi:cytochrome bd-type quinol oxidase subunit 2
MARSDSRQLDIWTKIWLGCAALWSLGLVAAGFYVKSYSSTNGPGLTLIQENGLKVLAPLSAPFVAVVIVAFALWHRQRAQRRGVGVLVWIVFSLLALLVVLGALTIGPFIAPTALFVLLAITSARNQMPSPEPAAR